MIKVLVVEDMDITREDILGLIDWEQHGFELLPSARNGRIGLEHALRYRPDIVLTDIKMPVMTGLDMMKEIREKIPGTKFILLTAYEEFEYAKRALEMGTQAFLLKYEIDSEILLRELNKCVESIRKERRVEDMTTRARLDRLLTKGGYGVQEIQSAATAARDSFFPWIGGSILLDIWCFKRRNDIGEDNLQDALREELRQYRFVCLKVKEREYVIFVEAPDSHSQMEKKRYLREFILSVQGVFSSLLDTQTAVAIGGEVKGSRDIPAAKKAGEELLQYRIFRKGGCILEEKPEECLEEQKEQIARSVDAIGADVGREDYANARARIETLYIRDIAQAGSIDLLKRMTVKLSYYFRQKGYEVRLPEFDEWLDRVSFNMLIESVDHTAERFGYLLDILREHTDRRYSRKVREAMAYIREHYTEDVGLNETAASLDVSPIYLSHLFKKEAEITFSAYITRLRIEKAKELLRQGDRKIYEISELVGYQTVQYFTKVFKKETGKTPGEFE